MQPLTNRLDHDTLHRHADLHAAPPHERILAVARELFCRDGIHATGIDRILSLAGASKMTLYSRFGSKEALVRVVLHKEGQAWRERFFTAFDAASSTPAGRLAHAVLALEPWLREPGFTGCAFINAAAEHTKGEPWIREIAAQHHRIVLDRLATAARDAGASHPDTLARQIVLILDGTIAALTVAGNTDIIATAHRTLQAVLAQSLPATTLPATA